MIRSFFALYVLLMLLSSCLNTAQVTPVKQDTTLKEKKEGAFLGKDDELLRPFLQKTLFSVHPQNAKKNDNGFYSLEYTFSFEVSSAKEKVYLEYQILDSEEVVLSEGKFGDLAPQHNFSETVSLYSYFNYEKLNYKILCKQNRGSVLECFEGSIRNPLYPKILDFGIQAVCSDFDSSNRDVSQRFFCHVETTDDVGIERVRIIPPSQEFYWDVMPAKPYENIYETISNIKDSTHPDYLESGEYHVQFLLGKNGLIQKTFFLWDLYGNDAGPNYGAAPAVFLGEELQTIEWELQDLSKLKKMEILLYEKNNQETPICCYQFTSPLEKCQKKDLLQRLQEKSSKKIKYNKKYFYRIRLTYENEKKEEVKYISTSSLYEITFLGFNVF